MLLKKSWNDRKYMFYVPLEKIIKHLVKKSFGVFNEPPPNTIEHAKTFFRQNVLFVCQSTSKIYLLLFQDFCNNIL